MNNQEIEKAIYELGKFATGETYDTEYTDLSIFDLAISALEHQLTNGWIPVSESPTEYGTYMVAWRPINMTETDVKAKTRSQTTHFYEILEYDPEDESGWLETIEQSEGAYKILAWQPLPEPYKELATDNNVVTKSGKDNKK